MNRIPFVSRSLAMGLACLFVMQPRPGAAASDFDSFNQYETSVLSAILSAPDKRQEWDKDLATSKAGAQARKEFEEKWHVRTYRWAETYLGAGHRFNVEEARRRGDASYIGEPGEREYLQQLQKIFIATLRRQGKPAAADFAEKKIKEKQDEANQALRQGDTESLLKIAAEARDYIKKDLDEYAKTPEYAKAKSSAAEVERRERERPTQPPTTPSPGTPPTVTNPPDKPPVGVNPAGSNRERLERWARCRGEQGPNASIEDIRNNCGKEPDNNPNPNAPPPVTVTPGGNPGPQPPVIATPPTVTPPTGGIDVPVPPNARAGDSSFLSKLMDNLPMVGAVAGAALGALGALAAMIFGAGILGVVVGAAVGAVVGYFAMKYVDSKMKGK